MLTSFEILPGRFMKRRGVHAWYSMPYRAYRDDAPPTESSFLNKLKNNFGNVEWSRKKRSPEELAEAQIQLRAVLTRDLPKVQEAIGKHLHIVCVPRSKASFSATQLLFQATLSDVVTRLPHMEDLTGAIKRVVDTRTTHWKGSSNGLNEGDAPYPGIAQATCSFDATIKGKDILLVDDVYTAGVGIDEDFLQACADLGVNSLWFYAVAKTGG